MLEANQINNRYIGIGDVMVSIQQLCTGIKVAQLECVSMGVHMCTLSEPHNPILPLLLYECFPIKGKVLAQTCHQTRDNDEQHQM